MGRGYAKLYFQIVIVFLVLRLPVSAMLDWYIQKPYRGTLAHIIAGEVQICDRETRIGLAYVYEVNKTFYGWGHPNKDDLFIAYNYEYFPNLFNNAKYVLSASDVRYFQSQLHWKLYGMTERICAKQHIIYFVTEVTNE